ncbi:brassinosteroid-responsive RING-H2 [Forsythia ovata]|uniref:Brassinosteroid-responsive RING-H2 n=1 Tax=Forsythia ovata TaxID=205694 RepID=A0ABD1WDP1_9LAMI
MGFPMGYSDLFLPKLLVYLLTILGFIRKSISTVFSLLGLGDFLETEMAYPNLMDSGSEQPKSVSAALIRELLPVVKFSDLNELDPPENCAVCLYEFNGDDKIRRLTNCRHIFHRNCLDRWMDHDQKTCPLCRSRFIPEELQEAIYDKLSMASGISDFYGEYLPITTGL